MSEKCLNECQNLNYKVIDIHKKVFAKELAIKFNSLCLQNNTLPRWIRCNNPNYSKRIKFRIIESRNKEFSSEINFLKNQINLLNKNLKNCCGTAKVDEWKSNRAPHFKRKIEKTS